MRIRQAIFVLATVATACARSVDPAPAAPERSDKLVRAAEPIPGQYLARLADGLGEADARALVARHGGTFLGWVPAPVSAVKLALPPERALALASDGQVVRAEEDGRVRAASLAWNLDRVDQRATAGDGAYAPGLTGAGVHVYVVDTDVLLDHPELAGRADAPASFAPRPPGACSGHGTHVAGVAAGATTGVAPGATVHAVRVLDCEGVGAMSDLLSALDWIRANHASPAVAVVGVTTGLSPTLSDALDDLLEAGVVVVSPAGNTEGRDACGVLPAASPGVITAGATTALDGRLVPSGQGRCVDLLAPGADVRSAWSDGDYALASGTSQAAAHVAGAAALFLEAHPDATPARVADALAGNATVGAVSGLDARTPNRLLYVGFVPAGAADTVAPAVALTAPAAGAQVGGDVVVTAAATDAVGVSQVEVLVDGAFLGADGSAAGGWQVPWRTGAFGNGKHVLTARAYDAAGNVGVATAEVTVSNPGNAAWDATLGAPACAGEGPRCATGELVVGRGPAGPEANAPSTLQSSCEDGAAGTWRLDESIEAVEVSTLVPGHALAEGEWVDVAVTAWGYTDQAYDRVDLHFATDAGAPAWHYLGTVDLETAGEQVVHFKYKLPASPEKPVRALQAVRATIRYGTAPAACTTGPYDDHDDLAFAVAAGTPDRALPLASIVSPAEGAKLPGRTLVQVSAADQGGGEVRRVELLADGALVATATEKGASGLWELDWDADAATLGAHVLQAIAYDSSGNAGESAPVKVEVQDGIAPTVALDLPSPGDVVGGAVHVEAIAADNRLVRSVTFRADDLVIGTATSPPWAVDWPTGTRNGAASLTATASDGFQATRSAPVEVTIDNEKPKVAFQAPAADAVVSGRVVKVVIDATDGNGVERVEVWAGDQLAGLANKDAGANTWRLDWNSGLRANGPVTLTARAFDAAGNVGEATRDVDVLDVTDPAVAFTAPADGAIVHGVVQVSADASDDGVIGAVAFRAGARPLGTDEAAPFTVSWNTADDPDGPLTLTAEARDGAGRLGTATRTVTVDNSGPTLAWAVPAAGVLGGRVQLRVVARDPAGVDRVELWTADALLGAGALVPGKTDEYELWWNTTAVDNRPFSLRAVARDGVGNVSTSPWVNVTVSNPTTAERDATLGVPACAASAAWCFSGTLLDGAGKDEAHAPNTLGGLCQDGIDGSYHVTESIDGIMVTADGNKGLAAGVGATVTVRYWAAAANEADQIDVWHAADARNPSWILVGTITPTIEGADAKDLHITVPSGALQVVRANFRFAQVGPDTCSGGAYGDRDDLVFAVDAPVDTVPPVVAIEGPVDGGTVTGMALLRASASDDRGVARIEFLVDGQVIAATAEPRPAAGDVAVYEASWAGTVGAHVLRVRAYDTSGNEAITPAAQVTVAPGANAALDADLAVPACADVGTFCDTGALVEGRGSVGPEAAAPNTIAGTCQDGGHDGVLHAEESIDQVTVASVDGLSLAAGKRARVDVRLWAYDAWGDDALDLFYTSTPEDPHWIRFDTVYPTGPGLQVLSSEWVLPPGERQAARAQLRYQGTPDACSPGIYDDRDDVVFAVDYTPNASFDRKLKVPACAVPAASCDSGALVVGRGLLGPEPDAPNTLAGAYADGAAGAFHVDSSVDRVLVRTDDLSTLRRGDTVRVEVWVFASDAWASERVDLFTSGNPTATTPGWTHATTLRPTRPGLQVLVGAVAVPAADTVGLRARLNVTSWFLPVSACGTGAGSAKDDHDDLVFAVAP
jgi:large repetitive protein